MLRRRVHLGLAEAMVDHVENGVFVEIGANDGVTLSNTCYFERELGWRPRYTFEQALPETIAWYQSQDEWLQRVTSGAYREYYAAQYGS